MPPGRSRDGDYRGFLLDLRALPRCFFPGGPPGLPDGVLASPGFFCFPIAAGYVSIDGFVSAAAPVSLPTHAARDLGSARVRVDVVGLSVTQVPVFALVGPMALPWLPPLAPTASFVAEFA